AGTRGHQHAADLAGRARITFGGMHGALLVADQDVLDAVLLEQLVIDWQNRAARIAEDMLNALIGESFEHHLSACHCARHVTTHGVLNSQNRARGSESAARSKLKQWRKSQNKARTLRLDLRRVNGKCE